MANPIDRHARKQVLLTRIAFERGELRRDMARVQQATHLPNLLRAAVGGRLGRSLFGSGGASGRGGWVEMALSLLGRYRVTAALLGGAVPVLRGRRGWPRVLRLGGLAAAAWFGWRAVKGRGDKTG